MMDVNVYNEPQLILIGCILIEILSFKDITLKCNILLYFWMIISQQIYIQLLWIIAHFIY